VDSPTVLIISDEVDFSRRITARWQMERHVPAFTLLSGELWPRFAVDVFDVAIVGELRRDLLSVVLEPLHSTGQPVFCVCRDTATAQLVRERWPRISILRPGDSQETTHWLETLVLVAGEVLHRAAAEFHARRAEQHCAPGGVRGRPGFVRPRSGSHRPSFARRSGTSRGSTVTDRDPSTPGDGRSRKGPVSLC